MIRKLSSFFLFFLFWGSIGVSLAGDSLSQQFFQSVGGVELSQGRMRLFDEVAAERTETHLSHRTVEEDLSRDICVRDAFLQVAHQHQVSGFVETVMEGMVIDLAQHGSSFESFVSVFVDQL